MRKNIRNAERRLLAELLEEGYHVAAWHGPNLGSALRGVGAALAARSPGRGRHTIWEIALHCAYWKYVVRRRLLGLPRGSFARKGSNWFALPADRSAASWKRDLALLETTHRELLDTLECCSDDALRRHARMVRGAAFHDIYHAGQIRLLRRMLRSTTTHTRKP